MNEILATADAARVRGPGRDTGNDGPGPVNPYLARLASLYSEIWTLISSARFCLFFAVSFFIYQSKPDMWGVSAATTSPVGGYGAGGSGAGEAISGLDQLKNRVVFTYGFVEMTFWLWVSAALDTLVVSIGFGRGLILAARFLWPSVKNATRPRLALSEWNEWMAELLGWPLTRVADVRVTHYQPPRGA